MLASRLPDALIRHSAGWLCWLDRTSLSQSCRSVRTALKNFDLVGNAGFKAETVRRLSALGIDGKRFCELLLEHECVLSGSFVLQCIIGADWMTAQQNVELVDRSDIDIFFAATDLGVAHAFAHALDPKIDDCCIYHNNRNGKFEVAKAIVNLIASGEIKGKFYRKQLATLVRTEFDFPFVMNVFDGERLMIYDPRSIMERKCVILDGDKKFMHYTDQEMERRGYVRASKYAKRGFSIDVFMNSAVRSFTPDNPEPNMSEISQKSTIVSQVCPIL